MLLSFFERLRTYGVPVSTRELLDCLNVFEARLIRYDLNDFYALSRTSLVKDEKYYDRFDRAFEDFFSGLDSLPLVTDETVVETLHQAFQLSDRLALSENELEQINEQLAQALAEQQANEPEQQEGDQGEQGDEGEAGDEGEEGDEGHKGEQGDGGEEGEQGDDGQKGKGNDGVEGEGLSEDGELGEKQEVTEESSRKANKLWQLRRFEDYDETAELGTRNLKMALRRVRKFARTGADLELDLDTTIRNTARQAGLLDIVEVPERHNSIKVLLFLDIGGSMDDHIELCNQLFSAARYEFKYLDSYYFHNFVYENLWTENERRVDVKFKTWDMLRKFGSDYKIIFVGDANMGMHEITESGGSVEHFNAESGDVWIRRILEHFTKVVWLNPVQEKYWQNSNTTGMIKRIFSDRMYPLTVEGIEQAARYLVR